MRYESGGNPAARNPRSSALGLYQLTNAARQDVAREFPALANMDFSNPKVQEQYREGYKSILRNRLITQHGIDPDENDINRAWVVGDTGYARIRNSDPNLPLAAVLSPEAIAINPNLQNKTVGEFLSDPNPYTVKSERRAVIPEVPRRSLEVGDPGDTIVPRPGLLDLEFGVQDITGEDPRAPYAVSRSIETPRSLPRSLPPLPTIEPTPRDPVKAVDVTQEYITQEEEKKPEERISALDQTLQSTRTQEQIAALTNQKPPQGADPQAWLGAQFSRIFGDKGIFNERELLKFGILAAGGLLTGGSIGGSIRYAGLAAIKSAEERYQGEKQAEAQDKQFARTQEAQARQFARTQAAQYSKDQHDRNQQLESTFLTTFGQASVEARDKAMEVYNKALVAPTPQEREKLFKEAILINQSNRSADEKGPKIEVMYDRENPSVALQGYWQGKEFYVRDPGTSSYKAVDPKKVLITGAEARAERTQRTTAITNKLEGLLIRATQGRKGEGLNTSEARSIASGLSEEALQLKQDFPNMSDEDFAAVVETGMQNILEEMKMTKGKGAILDATSPDAFRKYVYGNAVISTRKATGGQLYKVGDKRPSMEAISDFTTSLDKHVAQIARSTSKPTTYATVLPVLEQEWLSPKNEKLRERAKVMAEARPGYSPFLLWITGKVE